VSYELEAGVSLRDEPTAKIFVELNGGDSVASSEVAKAAEAAFAATGVADATEVIWESVRLRAAAATPHPELPSRAAKESTEPKKVTTTRQVWTGAGFEDVATFDIADLAAGDLIAGPAVIDCEFTTIPVSASRSAHVDGAGNVILRTSGSN
jgi:N-methylhydantoinase A/oxoprolinase/acetone carboxylase beta subunit